MRLLKVLDARVVKTFRKSVCQYTPGLAPRKDKLHCIHARGFGRFSAMWG